MMDDNKKKDEQQVAAVEAVVAAAASEATTEDDDPSSCGVDRMDLNNNNKNGNDDDDNNDNNDAVSMDTEAIADDDDDDDDKSDDDDDDDKGEKPSSSKKSSSTPEENLIKAMQYKEDGNVHFKNNELDDAIRCYRRGCNQIKHLNTGNTGDEQVQSVLIALLTNMSMIYYKQNKYTRSVETSTRAITIDPANVKALYRRAVAYRKLGNIDKAKIDLRDAIKLDPTNNACKKEFFAIKKELEDLKQTQKKALAKAFTSNKDGTSFLYDDKEAEYKRKVEIQKQKELEEVAMNEKRKQQWEDECVTRMANNLPAISFDEWDKQRKENEEKKQKEEDEKKKQEEKRIKEEKKKAKAAAKRERQQQRKDDDDDDDDDELTEQELAAMRGYKKTADGRTTSYFTRELSEQEKSKIGCIAPKRLDQQENTTPNSNGNATTTPATMPPPHLPSSSSSEGASRSAWNQAGTWEEKDTTSWCNSQLRKRLEETTITTDDLDCDITSIEELTGDASVAIAGGKKRYIFDFHVKLKYEIHDPNIKGGDDDNNKKKKIVAKGLVRLPDICSTEQHDELEVLYESYKKRPSTIYETRVHRIRQQLTNELRTNVQRWIQDFNEMY